MRPTLAALSIAALIAALSGCLGSAGDAGRGAASRAPPGERADVSQASLRKLFAPCALRRRAKVREASRFARMAGYPARGDARLLLSKRSFRLGSVVPAVPVNRTRRDISYGVSYRLWRREGVKWRTVPPLRNLGFRLLLLTATPEHAGPCVPVLVPTEYEPGRYRVELQDASGALAAEFRVVGPPVERSRWERHLDRRARGLEPAVSKHPTVAAACVTPPRSIRVVSARLGPDTPMPRCLRVHPDQRLRLVNSTEAYGQPGRTVTVLLGSHRATLDPGEAVTFHEPFGAYLAPGDHPVENGPEILLHGH